MMIVAYRVYGYSSRCSIVMLVFRPKIENIEGLAYIINVGSLDDIMFKENVIITIYLPGKVTFARVFEPPNRLLGRRGVSILPL